MATAQDEELVKRMASLYVAQPVKKSSSTKGTKSTKSFVKYSSDRYSKGGKRKLRKRRLSTDIQALSKKQQAALDKTAAESLNAEVKNELECEAGMAPLAEEEEVEFNWSPCTCKFPHPPVPEFDPPNNRRCNFYWQVADRFPYVTLHRTLLTEIKFVEADKDCSGTIEIEELYGLLKGIFKSEITDKMVILAFKYIDKDKSGTLDFLEVLSVMNSVIQREEVFLPDIMRKNFSKICSIQ